MKTMIAMLVMALALMVMPARAQTVRIDTMFAAAARIQDAGTVTGTIAIKYSGNSFPEFTGCYPDSVHIGWYAIDSVKVQVKYAAAFMTTGGNAGTYNTATITDTISVAGSATIADYALVAAGDIESKDWLKVTLTGITGNKHISPGNKIYCRVERFFHYTAARRI